jgi:hypothetical protein
VAGKPKRKTKVNSFCIKMNKPKTTPYGGCLGSREDEERSEMRYVMRIAGTSESSSF